MQFNERVPLGDKFPQAVSLSTFDAVGHAICRFETREKEKSKSIIANLEANSKLSLFQQISIRFRQVAGR